MRSTARNVHFLGIFVIGLITILPVVIVVSSIGVVSIILDPIRIFLFFTVLLLITIMIL